MIKTIYCTLYSVIPGKSYTIISFSIVYTKRAYEDKFYIHCMPIILDISCHHMLIQIQTLVFSVVRHDIYSWLGAKRTSNVTLCDVDKGSELLYVAQTYLYDTSLCLLISI